MKKLIVVLIFISLAPIWSADTKKIPPEITAFLGNVQNDPNDEGVLPKTPEMYAFARFLAMNWKLLIAHFGEIAPDERMQRLIVFTAQVLPPREYVAFLNNLCDLRLEGKATKWATLAVLLSQSEKEAFLEYNYDRPEVAEVLRKLETIMSKDYPNEWKGYFQEAKSGKAKKDNEELYNELYNRTPESLDDGPSPLYKHLLATPTGTWGASKF